MGHNNKLVKICPLDNKHLSGAAELLINFEKTVDVPFASLLGKEYLSNILFAEVINDPESFGFVGTDDRNVVGFIICLGNANNFYKKIIKRHYFTNILTVLKRIIYNYKLPIMIFQIIDYLFIKRFRSTEIQNRVEAEILNFHINPKYRKSFDKETQLKFSDALIITAMYQYKKLGITDCIAVVMAENILTRLFYMKYGQNDFRSIDLFEDNKVVYNLDVGKFLS